MPDASPSITRGHEALNDQNRNARTEATRTGKNFPGKGSAGIGDGLAGGGVMAPPVSLRAVLGLAPAALSLVLGPWSRGFAAVLCLVSCCLVSSCTVVHKGENGTVTGVMFGTDADALTIDGPPPVLAGWQPVMDKKGVVIGQKPVYTTNAAPGQTALLASYGMNNSKSFGKGANVVTTTALGMVAAGVQKAKDAATAANEAKAIDASAQASKEAAALAAQKEANRSKEALMEFEMAAPAAVTP